MPKPCLRRHRIESLLHEGLAPLMRDALPQGAQGILTIRHISLNNDFSVATVAYAVTGGGGDDGAGRGAGINDAAAADDKLQARLEQQAWRWRRQLARSLNMRKTPQLKFCPDVRGASADRVEQFLRDIAPAENLPGEAEAKSFEAAHELPPLSEPLSEGE